MVTKSVNFVVCPINPVAQTRDFALELVVVVTITKKDHVDPRLKRLVLFVTKNF